MADNQTVFNHLLSNYTVETEDQGSGVHRQVVKIGAGADEIPNYDYQSITYDASDRISVITYKTGEVNMTLNYSISTSLK